MYMQYIVINKLTQNNILHINYPYLMSNDYHLVIKTFIGSIFLEYYMFMLHLNYQLNHNRYENDRI